MTQRSLESALNDLTEAVTGAVTSTTELAKTLKHARTAAATGKLADIDKSITQARQQLAIITERISLLESSWDFDARQYFESGDYTRELLAAMANEGLKPVDRDGRIMSYPSILRVMPADQTLEVDRKKERRVRPGFIAAELRKHRDKKTGIAPERLIEILYRAYGALVAGGKGTGIVRVMDIYDLLTQLPQAREYTKPEFGRDLVRLDMSDVRATKAGKRLELRADTAAKGAAVLSAVTPDGEVRLYSGVEFR